MREVFDEKIGDFAESDRRIVFHDGSEIGVFHWQGEFYAYENLCLHQGGPACEGVIMHKVEDVLAPDKTWLGQKFSAEAAHFVCPWHGYEYDIKTGECAGNRDRKSTRLNSSHGYIPYAGFCLQKKRLGTRACPRGCRGCRRVTPARTRPSCALRRASPRGSRAPRRAPPPPSSLGCRLTSPITT